MTTTTMMLDIDDMIVAVIFCTAFVVVVAAAVVVLVVVVSLIPTLTIVQLATIFAFGRSYVYRSVPSMMSMLSLQQGIITCGLFQVPA